MAKISLRMYNREIEGLIEQGQRLDEAIAHSRHILKTYPKHLETYRLLGKAYLEAKRYDAAVDIFQRVLVVAPEDFVSHVGMSIIADDKGKLDDAIWHMERAFEVQPSNAAIQAELQRLFGRRDGVEPPKIRLTRGALAHMYVQGELFTQAISEIRAVLANDPRRTDMQALLARAYYRNGQKTDATELCTELLSKYPYCLDANRLMAEILPGTQRADAAQEYRQRVIELDPYAAFAQDSLFRADNVADNLVTIERLEYTGVTAETPSALGIGVEPETAPATRAPAPAVDATPGAAASGNLPSWLQGTADESAAAAPPAPAPAPEDIPEFLRKAGWGAASEAPGAEAPVEPPPPAQVAPDTSGAVEGDLPEWVKALAPKEEPPAAAEPASPTAQQDLFEAQSPASQAFAADTPDWLRDLGPAPVQPSAADAEAASSNVSTLPPDAPGWLRDLGPTPSQPAAPVTEAASASADVPAIPPKTPDWLRDLDQEPAAPVTPAAVEPSEQTPDWLKELAGRELDEPATPAAQVGETDWLGELRSEQPAAAPAEAAAEESPDWLKEFDNDLETPLPKTTRLEPSMLEPPVPAVSTPPVSTPKPIEPPASGLGSLGTTAQEQDDAMAWLESLAAKHGAKPEELVTDPNARTDVAPEWVDKAKEIGEPEQPVEIPPPAADETGVWLRSLGFDEEKAEPAASGTAEERLFEFPSGFEDQKAFEEKPLQPQKEEPPAAEAALPETPDWLRGFGTRPGGRPELEDAPDWLKSSAPEESEPEEQRPVFPPEANVLTARLRPLPESEPAAAPAEPPPAEESFTDLPAWLAGLDGEEPAASRVPAEGASSDELPAWLKSEIEPEPEAKQPANPADWHPAQPKPAEVPSPVSELKAEPPKAREPVVEMPPPAAQVPQPVSEIPSQPAEQPEPAPEAPPQAAEMKSPVSEELHPVAEKPVSVPAPEPAHVEVQPPAPQQPAPAPARAKAAAAAKSPLPSLGDAQLQLGRGNISAALDIYGKLIRKGKSLEDIIRDLRDALYRYPVEVPLWQSLGDAYMRANRLQEALDAYTKAEELLR